MKENTNRLALKAGSWYIISNFALKSILILTTPIFTRMLSPYEFGITYTYTSWLGIFTIIGTLDIYSCVQIARNDFDDKDINSFVSSILSLSTLSLALLYIAIKLIGEPAIQFIGLPPILVDIMFLEILFGNAFTIQQTKHRVYFHYKEFVAFSALIAILSPLIAIFLINLQRENLYYGKIIGNAMPKLIISFFIYLLIMRKGKCIYKKEYWKYALIISLPLIPHHLAGNVLSHFDRIMINKYASISDTGLYSLSYSYATILSIIWTSFNQAWTPWFLVKMKDDNVGEIKRFVKPYVIAFTCIFLVILFIGPEAIKFFGPKEYWGGMWVVPPVLLGMFFQFIYSLYVNIEFYYKKTNYIAIGTVFAAVLNIVLNYIFIPIYGYLAAAYTTLAGYFAIFILHFIIAKKWESRDLYGTVFVFSWMALVITITILATVFYNYIIIRFILLVSLLFLATAKYKSQLQGITKILRRVK